MIAGRLFSGFFSSMFMILNEKIIIETVPDYPFKYSEKLLHYIFFAIGILFNGVIAYMFEISQDYYAYIIFLPSIITFWRIFYFSVIFKDESPCYYFQIYISKLEKEIEANNTAIERNKANWDYNNYISKTSTSETLEDYVEKIKQTKRQNSSSNNNRYNINLNIN